MNSKELRRLAGTEYTRMALIALGVVALLAVVIWVPKLSFIQPGGLTKATDRAKAESDLRGHLLQALAGLVLAVGAFYTGRTFAQNRKEQDRTYALAREGQITERFTRAVEQLGDEKLDIRLGGIYALERIGRDSETHYEPVMEVLTAFLRENTRWRREKEAEDAPRMRLPRFRLKSSSSISPKQPPSVVSGPTADFQAVATVLARRDRRHERPDYWLDLNRVDLRGASLQLADLSGADLKEADLTGANLREAFLRRAKLSRANLSKANLMDANLSGAFLREANLSGAFLREANLSGAFLREANLSGAELSKAVLTEAELFRANLSKANLIEANLGEAYLMRADFTGANLADAVLTEAHLSGANLSKAYLIEADLTGADLHGANLSGAFLRGANLSGAELSKAVLTEADLHEAKLTKVDLNEAKLTKVDLNEADLSGADLSSVRGLSQEQLNSAFTDEYTKLPEYLQQGATQGPGGEPNT
jgi:uncharacterized protein YjbI with pentapeptide repeats